MEPRYCHFPQLSAFYRAYLENQELSCFLEATAGVYTPGTLQRLVFHHEISVRRAAVLALTSLGDFCTSCTLVRALRDPDPIVAMLAETAVKMLWRRDGNDDDRRQLSDIIMRINRHDYTAAIVQATVQISRTPDFAEVWHQRGIAWFARGEYALAAADFRRAMELNPQHFEAAAMLGHAFLHRNQKSQARKAFRRSLRVNPGMKNVRRELKSIH